MQRKYNMALQHFYQAATNKYVETDDNFKKVLKDLSGSEDELCNAQLENEEQLEMKYISRERRKDRQETETDYFSFHEKTRVRNPQSICTKKGCFLLILWICLFTVGVVGITFFIHKAVKNMHPSNHKEDPVIYLRYKENENFISSEASPDLQDLDGTLASCEHFRIAQKWTADFASLQSAAAFRLVDVNEDGTDDAVIGFRSVIDGYGPQNSKEICNWYFNGTFPCSGGVLAIDGATGNELWRHYTVHEVYAVNCNGDLDEDGVADCLCGGRGGVFEALSGKSGLPLWSFHGSPNQNEIMNLFTAQFVYDMDGDGVMEVLQVQGGDRLAVPRSKALMSAKVFIISGKTGVVLSSHLLPDGGESYFSPVLYSVRNGTKYVILGSGGEAHGGSIFIIPLHELYYGHMQKAVTLQTDFKKGFVNPPILVDINHDGTVDIIAAAFSSSVTAYDGESLQMLWSFAENDTETYCVPAVGYFNDDNVTDFLIQQSHGPRFPFYYDSFVLVLDGKTGQPLTEAYKASAYSFSSPLSVSIEGSGNDLFLFWSVDCLGYEHIGGYFAPADETTEEDLAIADTCLLRFNTTSFGSLSIMSRSVGFPGKFIYASLNISVIQEARLPTALQRRRRRYVGAPSHDEMPWIFPTGVVTDSLNAQGNQLRDSFDVMFATNHRRPATAKQQQTVSAADVECINEYRKRARAGLNDKDGVADGPRKDFVDSDDPAVKYCLSRWSGPGAGSQRDLRSSQLSVRRYEVTCQCANGKKCAKVLPQREQGWAGYMGSLSNGYFVERPKSRFHGKS